VISRFTVSADPNIVDQTSELVILEVSQPFSNHNGGSIAFGPEGYLYAGYGDGGSGSDPLYNGQNLETLLATVIRIDVDNHDVGLNYGIPSDNPFATSSNGERPEIWAHGLRNPWRLSFDNMSGVLWVGDVGQSGWEEIDIVERGGNYGCNTLEGTHCFDPGTGCDPSGTILPVAEYDHLSGCSVIGGFVYRGSSVPALIGAYIYADFCSGLVWGIRSNDLAAGSNLISSGITSVTPFGEDAAGEMYMLAFGGTVRRIIAAI